MVGRVAADKDGVGGERRASRSPRLHGRRRGAIAVATALTLVPLIGAVGVAVDGARGWLVHARLTASLNAAALAGAQALAGGEPAVLRRTRAEQAARDVFWANFCGVAGIAAAAHCGAHTRGFLGTTLNPNLPRVAFDGHGDELTTITVSAEVNLPTTLTRVLGLLPGAANRTQLPVASSAVASTGGRSRLELVMVLDVSGEMGRNYHEGSRHQFDFATDSKVARLRSTALTLYSLLYEGGISGGRVADEVYVGLVPYTTSVNLKKNLRPLVDFDAIPVMSSTDQARSWRSTFGLQGRRAYGDFDYGSGTPSSPDPGLWDRWWRRRHYWRGCYEVREEQRRLLTPAEWHLLEAPPARAGRFRPYFFASTLRDDSAEHTLGGKPVRGDNDWCPHEIAGIPLTDGRAWSRRAITEHWEWAREKFSIGPNVGCPAAEIHPLMDDWRKPMERTREKLETALVTAHRGGSMANVGLQAGWWVISPEWSSVFEPVRTEYGVPAAPYERLGRGREKVIVLMSNGRNRWYDSPHGAPRACGIGPHARPQSGLLFVPANDLQRGPDGMPPNTPPWHGVFPDSPDCPPGAENLGPDLGSDYTSYGRLADTPFESLAEAEDFLDRKTLEVCAAIKARGIRIITITFGLEDDAARDLQRSCASAPTDYYDLPTSDDLQRLVRSLETRLQARSMRLMPPPR